MNKNTYLNVLVTVILIVMAVLCFVFVSALDQLRFAMEDMNRSMKNIESRLAACRIRQSARGGERHRRRCRKPSVLRSECGSGGTPHHGVRRGCRQYEYARHQ